MPVLRACLILAIAAGPAFAQGRGQNDSAGGSEPSYAWEPSQLPPVAAYGANTAQGRDTGPRVVQALQDAQAFCGGLPDRTYRIDCLAERIEFIAGAMPRQGPYAETRAALDSAAKKLRAVATRYADPGKTRNRYAASTGPRPQRSQRAIVAVRPQNQVAANRAAVAILEEAETVLLRSSATQVAVGPQIQRIAAAVESNKVLLRSA